MQSLAAWVGLGASFLLGPAANAQNTGKWEAINSSGSAVASEPTLDVSQFVAVGSTDIGTATADCISALAATHGGTCDARSMTGALQINSQLALSGSSGYPIIWLVSPTATITCSNSIAGACITFGNSVSIECGMSQSAQQCLIQTYSTSQTILGPATPTSNRDYLYVRGVSFSANRADSLPVVDLTDTSHSTIQDSFINNDGGGGSGILLDIDSNGTAAYYNAIMNTWIYMDGSGNGIDVRNGANELKVFGGAISNSGCAVSVTNTSSGGTDGLHIFGTDAEAYTDAALCSKPSSGGVYGVDWTGGRFESNTGVIADVAPTGTGSVAQVYIIAPNINGSQGSFTDSTHAVTWLYAGKTSGIPIFGRSGSNWSGTVTLSGTSSAAVTFQPSFVNSPVCTANDQTGVHAVQVSATNTTLTLTLSGTSSDTIDYSCVGNPN